jgi:hypothetical protein
MISGDRTDLRRDTFRALAAALRVSEDWLDHGGGDDAHPDTPRTSEPIPPRPCDKMKRYGELPGWASAVAEILSTWTEPPRAAVLLAGADLPVLREVKAPITPEIAYAVSIFAWETSALWERSEYTHRTLDIEAHQSAITRPVSHAPPARRPKRIDSKVFPTASK